MTVSPLFLKYSIIWEITRTYCIICKKDIRLPLYLHALQYGSTFLLEDSTWVLNRLSGSSPDVAHPDGHPGYTCLTCFIVVLELHRGGKRKVRIIEREDVCEVNWFNLLFHFNYLIIINFILTIVTPYKATTPMKIMWKDLTDIQQIYVLAVIVFFNI